MPPNMEYDYLGNSGLKVSKFCLGCMNFGSGNLLHASDWEWTLDDEDKAIELIREAVDQGINFFDTANVYSLGESEKILGKAVEGFRDDVVIATKVFFPMGDAQTQRGLSRKHILEEAEASLERLGTDYIDLYQIHRWDDNVPIEETLSALDYLIDEGLVRYIGASSMAAWKFTKALYISDIENRERFSTMQLEYNLLNRHEEENSIPVCRDQDIGVISWSPLGGGFLTGKHDSDEEIANNSRAATDSRTQDRFTSENWEVLEVVQELAREKDATPAQISLAWLLNKDSINSPIIGPKSIEHLRENIASAHISLTKDEIKRLEDPVKPVWSGDHI